MTSDSHAYLGAEIHDGVAVHAGQALLVGADGAASMVHLDEIPEGCRPIHLDGGLIAPGFVDLQVNGGGGVMFNDDPCVATLRKIAEAHRGLGTAGFLPTLISDTLEMTTRAIAAVAAALEDGVPGILGLHLEGPHLSVARKGAHAAEMIRPMGEADLAELLMAAETLPNLMVTLAPESATEAQIATLAAAGVIVSLGHTDAHYVRATHAFDAGARAVTHLYNAMSGLHHRDPGLVGAAFDHPGIFMSIIADGIHVHPSALALALRAKSPETDIFLVSDAMAPAGTGLTEFTLNGRKITRAGGRLTLEDGTLAGADLDLMQAIGVMMAAGVSEARAVAKATSVPVSLLTDTMGYGVIDGPVNRLNHLKDGAVRPLD